MSERAISIAYGIAAGAGLVHAGVPALVLIPVFLTAAVGLELYRGHKRKREEST